jgi:hypothetical protein
MDVSEHKHTPYNEPHLNVLYNLLFCDDPDLFKTEGDNNVTAEILAEVPNVQSLEQIASDEEQESRIRALAYNRLRSLGQTISEKVLLGVIVEVPLDQGLDTLAAYADGRVRYLNQSGSASLFEGGPPEVEVKAKELVAVSESLINAIGPWDKERLPPPASGNVRMTFLVSDGLYFGEGPFEMLAQDSMGGPVLAKAGELLNAVVDASSAIQH